MKCIIVTVIFVLFLDLNTKTEALDVVTMNSDVTEVDLKQGSESSGILKSHDKSSYPSGMSKTILITAPMGGVQASVRLVDLRPRCTDNLTLFDDVYKSTEAVYCNKFSFQVKDYDDYETKSFFAPSGRLGVTFKTAKHHYTSEYEGFQITYTAVKEPPCSSSEFYCTNMQCIAKELTCDGHNHCGDNSDRTACGSHMTTGTLVGIIFGVIFLIIAIVLIAFYARRRYNASRAI